MSPQPQDRTISLRTWVGLLLVAAAVITFCIVGGILLLYRLPQLETAQRQEMQQRAASADSLLDHYTAGVEGQLMAIASLSGERGAAEMQAYLEAVVNDGSLFDVAFLLEPSGRVQGVGLPEAYRQAAAILRGVDFAFNPLLQEAHAALQKNGGRPVAVWSDRYLSVLSGKNTVGVAVATTRHIVVGEVSLERILEMLASTSKAGDSLVTIIDRRGLWLSSSSLQAPGQYFNFASLPVFLDVLRGERGAQKTQFLGETRIVGGVVSDKLNWVILASAPAGLEDPSTRMTVLTIVVGFVGALLLSIALSPFASLIVVRRLQPLIEFSQRIADGENPSDWPAAGRIRELEQLAGDLRRMVETLRGREAALRLNEQKLETIFHASPTAMLVAEMGKGTRVIDVNAAWVGLFRRGREEVVGLDAELLGVWCDPEDGRRFLEQLRAVRRVEDFEAWLHCGDGVQRLAQIAARTVRIGEAHLLLVTLVDVTEQRRIEREVLNLNAELEQRVTRRTEELSRANAELGASLHNLRTMQAQLVQAEKNAALGGMVAGVAHELNTPVGNALMAATTIQHGVQDFRGRLAQRVRRSEFESFLELISGASEIAERNLHRAADLVGSFKQVAVDQTSDQRRRFDLSEVVREILLTLQPSLRCTPFTVHSDIIPGCEMDSYPGALGQVLTNLINNAILHGLAGRSAGSVQLGAHVGEAAVDISVSDDGCGMAPEVRARIFEPFFTSKRGSGGTGLGLHICQGIVSRVLGGSISVHSSVGAGSTFTLHLPRVAPRSNEAAAGESAGSQGSAE